VNIETGAFHCFRCGWKGRVGTESIKPIVRFDDPSIAERKRERLRQTWRQTLPLNHSDARAARSYLESRALSEILSNPPVVLRAHQGLTYWDGSKDLGTYPAMIALFHGAGGQPVTLHVTYLRRDGCAKASVPNPKKILGVPVKGATRGGAIHLYEPKAGILGIAEGIESALSMHLLQKLPTWSSYCADNMEWAHLPKNLRELHIGIDLDVNGKGEQVAQGLAKRVHQFSPRTKVFFVTPEVDGTGDLNDELRRRKYGHR
jgi:putative DNA primase/helicase